MLESKTEKDKDLFIYICARRERGKVWACAHTHTHSVHRSVYNVQVHLPIPSIQQQSVWIAAAADTWFLRYKPVMYTSLWSSACHALQQCKPPLCTVKDVCILSVIRNEEISLYMRASTSDNVYLRCTRAFPHQESGIACMVVQDHREQKREKDRDQ